jgi:hypothetical protein
MPRMLFVALTLICLPVKAEVLTLSCDGTMNAEEQAKPHAITKMGLIVNFDAGVVTGFTGITARIDEVNANSVSFKGTTTILRERNGLAIKLMAFGESAFVQSGKGSTHTSVNGRSSRFDDDRNLIVVAVTEPVQGRVVSFRLRR